MYRVLLADDEPIITSGLKKLICWEDYGISPPDTAKNGKEAWERMRETSYDILITDIRMPEMDGIALLKSMREQNFPTKSIVLSGYEDFGYIKSALCYGIENYLLKPVNEQELSSTLLQILDKLESEAARRELIRFGENTLLDNVLFRWLTGDIEETELLDRCALLGIPADREGYLASILTLPKRKDAGYPELQRLRDFILSRIPWENPVYCAITPEHELILLTGGDSPDRHSWKRELRQILSGLPLTDEWFLTIGTPANSFQGVPASFAFARRLQTYALFMPARTAVDASSEERYGPAGPDISPLCGLLDCGDMERCLDALDRFFEELAPYADGPLLRGIVTRSLGAIFDTRKPAYWRENPLIPDLYTLLNGLNLEEIKEKVKAAAKAYMAELSRDESGIHPAAERILRYIAQNYERELSLKTLADELHYTPSYLGKIFKQEFHQLFSDYLCAFRIEKAKKLLASESYKLTEIAQMVGFQNSNYFSNVFKKVVGVYPSVFRSGRKANWEE